MIRWVVWINLTSIAACSLERVTVCDGAECRIDIGATCGSDGDCTSPSSCEVSTGARCLAGACVYSLLSCPNGEICFDGTCRPCEIDPQCDDRNPCTVDVCDPTVGCTHRERAGDCDDRDPCTRDERCDAAVCTGDPVVCGPPPEDGCADGDTRVVYGPGVCDAADASAGCDYVASEVDCGPFEACEQGACVTHAVRFDAGLENDERVYLGERFVPLVPADEPERYVPGNENMDRLTNSFNYSGPDIAGAEGVEDLYHSEVWVSASSATVAVPVTPGDYTVHLHFVDWHPSDTSVIGDRVFDVEVEGEPILDDFDIIAVGGKFRVVIESFETSVTDGQLRLTISNETFYAQLSALEIVPRGVGPLVADGLTPATVVRLDAGLLTGSRELGGRTFTPLVPEADPARYVPGNDAEALLRNSHHDTAVAGTSYDELYQTETWAVLAGAVITIPVANAAYAVHLHFVDWHPTSTAVPGDRVFSVDLEGVRVLQDFDIIAEVGKDTALIESFPLVVEDGNIELELTNQVFKAQIAAVEILPWGRLPLR